MYRLDQVISVNVGFPTIGHVYICICISGMDTPTRGLTLIGKYLPFFSLIKEQIFPFRNSPHLGKLSNTRKAISYLQQLSPLHNHWKIFQGPVVQSIFSLTLVLLNPDIPCLCRQCRSTSLQLIWICTVCHSVCEFTPTTWIK